MRRSASSSTDLRTLGLAVFPGLGAQAVKAGGLPLVADIALDKVGLLDGDKDRFFLGIVDLDIVPLVPQDLHALDGGKAANPIVHMDHIVPGIEFHKGVYGRPSGPT